MINRIARDKFSQTITNSNIATGRYYLLLLVILFAGMALRIWLVSNNVPVIDSDESVVGLISLRALRGEFFSFFWGQPYMGTLEPILIAPFTWLLGPTQFGLRTALILESSAIIGLLSLMASRAISIRVGLIAAMLLAIGPPLFDVLSIRAFGGYDETLMFGLLIILCALRGIQPRHRTLGNVLLLGLLIGLSVWTNPLVGPFIIAAGAILYWQRRYDLLGRRAVVLTISALVGAAPALHYYFQHRAEYFAALQPRLIGPERIPLPPSEHQIPDLGLTTLTNSSPEAQITAEEQSDIPNATLNVLSTLLHRVTDEVMVSWPILSGGFVGGTQSAGFAPSDYLQRAKSRPIFYAIALLIALAGAGLLIASAKRVVRNFVRLDSDSGPEHERTALRCQFEGALLIVSVMYPLLFLLRGNWSAIPRYLFPLYLVTPLVVAEADTLFGRWLGRWRTVPFAAVLAWNFSGTVALTPQETAPRDHGILIASNDQPILELFRQHNVHTIISNDYWVGFRIAFQSGDTIIPVMRFPDGSLGFNRFAPYVEQGLRDSRPAYLELTDAWEAKILTERWNSGLLPGYSLYIIDIYTVVVPPM